MKQNIGGNMPFLECQPLNEKVFEWIDCSDADFPWAFDGVQCTVQLPGTPQIMAMYVIPNIILVLDEMQCLWVFTDFGLFIRRLAIEFEDDEVQEIKDIGFDGQRIWILAEHQIFVVALRGPDFKM